MFFRWIGVCVLCVLCSGCEYFTGKPSAPGDIPVTFTDLSLGEKCAFDVVVNKALWKVNYLAMYLSEPEIKVEGRWVPLNFIENRWQSKDVALLQFHHACDDTLNNTHIRVDANDALLKRATALRLTLGLDFDDNHIPQAEQIPPLNKPAMFQSTREGHNFFRLELQNYREPSTIWSFLLASGGCDGETSDSKPTVCHQPNRVTISLPMAQNVSQLNLLASLQQILFRVNLNDVAECNMAKIHHESCEKVMKNLTGREWLRWDAPEKVYLKS
ncbi:MbnP family protein [Aestuariibacter sp. A3R04]|uniref:MbnP family protein n=1 Tax=Aestuariibacter sp. A3R04 TaxID=2841571 RepID=UPI001C080D39|nr:MbnP family protein [Aestuariibacter sp. A3R04]MBU3022050.1 metallo-mystery pair system four-Cys motif protein [Aestuariibacter sp. A3R04]